MRVSYTHKMGNMVSEGTCSCETLLCRIKGPFVSLRCVNKWGSEDSLTKNAPLALSSLSSSSALRFCASKLATPDRPLESDSRMSLSQDWYSSSNGRLVLSPMMSTRHRAVDESSFSTGMTSAVLGSSPHDRISNPLVSDEQSSTKTGLPDVRASSMGHGQTDPSPPRTVTIEPREEDVRFPSAVISAVLAMDVDEATICRSSCLTLSFLAKRPFGMPGVTIELMDWRPETEPYVLADASIEMRSSLWAEG